MCLALLRLVGAWRPYVVASVIQKDRQYLVWNGFFQISPPNDGHCHADEGSIWLHALRFVLVITAVAGLFSWFFSCSRCFLRQHNSAHRLAGKRERVNLPVPLQQELMGQYKASSLQPDPAALITYGRIFDHPVNTYPSECSKECAVH